MDCQSVEELAGAYALDAMPAHEVTLIHAHLRGCAACAELYGPMRETADLLPLAVEEYDPPARLRSRLIAAAALTEFSSALALGAADTTASEPGAALRALPPSNGPGKGFRPSVSQLALAAAVVIAVGLGAWNVALRRDLDGGKAQESQQSFALAAVAHGGRLARLSGDNGLTAAVVVAPDGSAAYLLGAMPAPPPGKAYEAWVIRDGRASPAGLVKSVGSTPVRLSGDFKVAQSVALTLEPESGSATPTLPILAQVAVSSE